MLAFLSQRERELWRWAGATLLAIYVSLYFVRWPVEWLRERGLLRITVAVTLLLVAAEVVRRLARRRPGRWEWGALVLLGGVYLAALVMTERTEERIHFIEYGVVGYLVHAALLERRSVARESSVGAGPGRVPAAVATLLTALAGWGDEGIQAVLPNRVYELRDVGLNALAGALAVGGAVVLAAARRRDRGGARALV